MGRPLASPEPAALDVEPEEERAPAPPARPGGSDRDLRRLVRTYWPVATLGLTAVVISLLARHLLFPALSWNRDEPVYLWQMETLRAGRFTTPDAGFPEFFHPWLSARGEGTLFSHFTIGWPLALAVGDLLFGTPDATLAFGAGLAVVGTYALARELTADHGTALVAAAVMCASPVLLVQGGVYLGYLFTLGLGLLFAAALLSGLRRRRPARIVVAGALVGYIFLTRPYDAVLWGVGATAVLLWSRRRALGTLLPAAGWLALGAAPFVGAGLAYNAAVVGGPLSFPNTASDPLDTFGFGVRRIMPGFRRNDFGPVDAVLGALRNAKAFRAFLFGGFLGVAVAAVGLWRVRGDLRLRPLIALSLVFPLGYLAFWGMGVSAPTSSLSAPIYFVPLYATASVLMASALVAAWRWRRPAAGVLVAVLAVATLLDVVPELGANRRISVSQQPLETARRPDGPALVFVPSATSYLLFSDPFTANDPDLDGPVVYALDRGAENLRLMEAMPDRTPWFQRMDQPPDELLPRWRPEEVEVSYVRAEVLRAGTISLAVRVRNTTGRPVVGVGVSVGERVEWRTLDTDSELGETYETSWTVGGPAAGGDVVPLDADLASFAVTAGFAEDEASARKLPVARVRYDYRVEGDELEVVLPGEALEAEKSRNRRRWVPAGRLPALGVDATGG